MVLENLFLQGWEGKSIIHFNIALIIGETGQ